MHVAIRDEANGMAVVLGAEGDYAPDVIDDLCTRALKTYRQTLVERFVMSKLGEQPAVEAGEGD